MSKATDNKKSPSGRSADATFLVVIAYAFVMTSSAL
jgi:hypothetical protein